MYTSRAFMHYPFLRVLRTKISSLTREAKLFATETRGPIYMSPPFSVTEAELQFENNFNSLGKIRIRNINQPLKERYENVLDYPIPARLPGHSVAQRFCCCAQLRKPTPDMPRRPARNPSELHARRQAHTQGSRPRYVLHGRPKEYGELRKQLPPAVYSAHWWP